MYANHGVGITKKHFPFPFACDGDVLASALLGSANNRQAATMTFVFFIGNPLFKERDNYRSRD